MEWDQITHGAKKAASSLLLGLLLLLTGCGQVGWQWSKSKQPKYCTAVHQDVASMSPEQSRQLLEEAKQALMAGLEAPAKICLNALITKSQKKAEAQALLMQINVDPAAKLGRVSRGYKVKEGDTFMTLAKGLWGNETQFYLLARFNGIIPNELVVGEWIKLPSVKRKKRTSQVKARSTAKPVVPQRAVPMTDPALEPSVLQQLKAFEQQQRYRDMVTLLEAQDENVLQTGVAQQYLANSYLQLARQVWSHSGDSTNTQYWLDKLSPLSLPDVMADEVAELTAAVQTEPLLQTGLKAMEQKQWERAHAILTHVLSITPDHVRAKDAQHTVVTHLVTYYFKQSQQARDQQDFHTEYHQLNRVLVLDPDHKLAKKRQQTVEKLIRRLENINR